MAFGVVVADVDDAAARRNFNHWVGRMIGPEDVVEIPLAQMAIVYLRLSVNGPLMPSGQTEPIADQGRSS